MSIIVGFIPTPQGDAALARGIEEARLRGQRLVLVNSLEGDEEGKRFLKVRDAIEEAEKTLAASGVEYEIHDFARGNTPMEDILQAVADFDGTLVVIGIRKRTPVGKFVLGSNASQIILHVDVPVLAVKAPGEDW